jgi:hypothetical protein
MTPFRIRLQVPGVFNTTVTLSSAKARSNTVNIDLRNSLAPARDHLLWIPACCPRCRTNRPALLRPPLPRRSLPFATLGSLNIGCRPCSTIIEAYYLRCHASIHYAHSPHLRLHLRQGCPVDHGGLVDFRSPLARVWGRFLPARRRPSFNRGTSTISISTTLSVSKPTIRSGFTRTPRGPVGPARMQARGAAPRGRPSCGDGNPRRRKR